MRKLLSMSSMLSAELCDMRAIHSRSCLLQTLLIFEQNTAAALLAAALRQTLIVDQLMVRCAPRSSTPSDCECRRIQSTTAWLRHCGGVSSPPLGPTGCPRRDGLRDP